jgi:hypothetical protein
MNNVSYTSRREASTGAAFGFADPRRILVAHDGGWRRDPPAPPMSSAASVPVVAGVQLQAVDRPQPRLALLL